MELNEIISNFPKYDTKILLWEINAKMGRVDIFKPTIGNEILRQHINDNGVRIVTFATLKNLVVMSKMFPHRNIRNTPGPL